MKRKKLLCGFIATLLLFFSVSANALAERLQTQDNTYILNLDNNNLGYQNDNPNSTDQSNQYLLTGNIESFDTGYGNTTATSDYALKSGLQPTFEANVPSVTTLSSVDGTALPFYDRLLFTINPNNNPTSADGALFAVQISISPSFTTFYYVNPASFTPDLVTNSNLSVYYQPCAQTTSQAADTTRWDCGTVNGLKRYIKGLKPNTTYYVRVIAKNGDFTNSQPGPSATATTGSLQILLDLSTNSVTFGTASYQSVNTTPAIAIEARTNAINGYNAHVHGQGNGVDATSGIYSVTKNKIILSTSGNLDASIGTEGYGLQATVQSGDATVANIWNPNEPGNNSTYAGQILRADQLLFSRASPSESTGDFVSALFLLNISAYTPASTDYTDIITYTLIGSF